MMVAFTDAEQADFLKRITAQLTNRIPCAPIVTAYGKQNKLKSLRQSHNGKCGFYVFVDNTNKSYLYVGSAYLQDLPTRVNQHLSIKDSGGTFRKKLCAKRSGCMSEKAALNYIKRHVSVYLVETPADQAQAWEQLAILTLKPQYNGELSKSEKKGYKRTHDWTLRAMARLEQMKNG